MLDKKHIDKCLAAAIFQFIEGWRSAVRMVVAMVPEHFWQNSELDGTIELQVQRIGGHLDQASNVVDTN